MPSPMSRSSLLRRLALVTLGLTLAATAVPASAGEPLDSLWMPETEDLDLPWKRARRHCKRAEVDGRSDFRLPTRGELEALAERSAEGEAAARRIVDSLDGAAAWSRGVSPSKLAWAASFEHGYLFRIHRANERGLRALCVRGPAPAAADRADPIEEGDWLRPLETGAESALLWPCTGERKDPVVVEGSLQPFREAMPPGPIRQTVRVDFIIDVDGRPRYVGPSPGTRERLGNLAVQTLETFLFEPATCDGEPIPVFYHLDFGAE